MKYNGNRAEIWVAVKVERGFISDAKVYESFDSAKQTERRWRSRSNRDYDEIAVIKSNIILCRSNRKRCLETRQRAKRRD
jgi:hypothetical protein